MCAQTPHRRCRSAFARKYLSGDPVKAKCGAPIEVQVIDQATGETVPGSQLKNVQLEVRRAAPLGLLWQGLLWRAGACGPARRPQRCPPHEQCPQLSASS